MLLRKGVRYLHVTKHGTRRLKERLGAGKKTCKAVAKHALERGICHNETTGKLLSFMDYIYLAKQTANNQRIYAEKVFVFHNETLITVIPLPRKFVPAVKKIKEKREKENGSKSDNQRPDDGILPIEERKERTDDEGNAGQLA